MTRQSDFNRAANVATHIRLSQLSSKIDITQITNNNKILYGFVVKEEKQKNVMYLWVTRDLILIFYQNRAKNQHQ